MSGQASFIAPTSVLKPIAPTAATTAIAKSDQQQQSAFRHRSLASASTNEEAHRHGIDRTRNSSSVQPHSSTQPSVSDSSSAPATSFETNSSSNSSSSSSSSDNNKGAHAPASSFDDNDDRRFDRPSGKNNGLSSDPHNDAGAAWSPWTERLQDHLRAFFSMHHKLFDLVAFYVVMFAINGQMTSLPTRLEWIGFCVQSIVALRRAFQTSIKHGLGLTSFLGMLDLLVGQLFLHQDRFLGLLPTVANILVYFYVINLTRGLVFGDSVSCLLWFLFGLVDIYRKDSSTASLLDLTPYKMIPVHTVGFGLYILMSELVEVMLHSSEPELVQGRYLTYSGGQKNGSGSSRRSNASDPSSNHLRFELCITEITPFTVSFCLNTLSDPLSVQDPDASAASASSPSSSPPPPSSIPSTPTMASSSTASGAGAGAVKRKSGVDGQTAAKSTPSLTSQSKGSSRQRSGQPMPIPGTSWIVSTADIAVHVNYIPWREVLYHYPDQQSFMIYGLTPSTDYEIEMKVYPYSSFVARVGTKASPPGMTSPFKAPEMLDPVETPSKPTKGRKKKNKKDQEKNVDTTLTTTTTSSTHGTSTSSLYDPNPSVPSSPSGTRAKSPSPSSASSVSPKSGLLSGPDLLPSEALQRTKEGQDAAAASASSSPSSLPAALPTAATVPKDPREEEMEQLRASIQATVAAVQSTKASLKKQKRDQAKGEALLRQEIEGLERGQAKAALQDQKRRQKLSFLHESIKQTQAAASLLSEELQHLIASRQSSTGRYHGAQMDATEQKVAKMGEAIKAVEQQEKQEIQQWNKENRQLQQEIKAQDSEQQQWRSKADKFQEAELRPLQLRLQRLEQQQVVWEVAAEASRGRHKQGPKGPGGRMHDHALATLEKEVEQVREAIQQTETTIQTLKTQNTELKARVNQEVEVWEGLEGQCDGSSSGSGSNSSSRMAHHHRHSRSRSTSQSSGSGSGIFANGVGYGGGPVRANGVEGPHSTSSPLLATTSARPFSQAVSGSLNATATSAAGGAVAGASSGNASRFSLGTDHMWSSSPFGFVTTLSPTLGSVKPKTLRQPDQSH